LAQHYDLFPDGYVSQGPEGLFLNSKIWFCSRTHTHTQHSVAITVECGQYRQRSFGFDYNASGYRRAVADHATTPRVGKRRFTRLIAYPGDYLSRRSTGGREHGYYLNRVMCGVPPRTSGRGRFTARRSRVWPPVAAGALIRCALAGRWITRV